MYIKYNAQLLIGDLFLLDNPIYSKNKADIIHLFHVLCRCASVVLCMSLFCFYILPILLYIFLFSGCMQKAESIIYIQL